MRQAYNAARCVMGFCVMIRLVASFWARQMATAVALLLVFLALTGCQDETPLPTRLGVAPTVALTAVLSPAPTVPPTWTAVPQTQIILTPMLTSPPRPTATTTATFPPTRTPIPTETAVPPTETPTPTPTLTPTIDPNAANWSSNLLPNGSFEEGDYLQNGQPELQLPTGWTLEYDEGPTGYGVEIWDVYRRPEVRVLSDQFLPPQEHALFIWDGVHTVKAFKGNGAISFRLFRDVYLEPGYYRLEINLFPDLVMAFNGNQKIWSDDPAAGEVRLISPESSEAWIRPLFGRKNTFSQYFTIEQAQTVRLGAAIRGNFAILNDGWFLDDWSLRRAEN